MMKRVIEAAKTVIRKNFQSHFEAVNCHHNCVQKNHHFGQDVYVTRKGAVRVVALTVTSLVLQRLTRL